MHHQLGYDCITNVYVCFQHAYRLNSLESRSHRSAFSHYSGQEYWLLLRMFTEICDIVAVLTIGIVSKGHDSTSWL
jgi:hypothetical protein